MFNNGISLTQVENLAKLYFQKYGRNIDLSECRGVPMEQITAALMRIIGTGESLKEGLQKIEEET